MRPCNNVEKKDSFRHILKSLASMYESSGSQFQFLRTNTGIQSGPDAFDESRFVMTFLTIFGSYGNIMQFQISSRSEYRSRNTRVIQIRVLRKVFSKQFCLNQMQKTTPPVH